MLLFFEIQTLKNSKSFSSVTAADYLNQVYKTDFFLAKTVYLLFFILFADYPQYICCHLKKKTQSFEASVLSGIETRKNKAALFSVRCEVPKYCLSCNFRSKLKKIFFFTANVNNVALTCQSINIRTKLIKPLQIKKVHQT